jgi:hypothetical protein
MVAGDRVSLLSEPTPVATIKHRGGWTLDALDEVAPAELTGALTDRWTLDDHPELKVFPDEP